MNTKTLTLSALLIALGTLTAHLVYIPIGGVAKIFPMQHTINVLSAVCLGPFGAVLNAFSISLLRNLLGTGSILAFPGSMIGALISAWFYQRSKKIGLAVIGEILGTGILGALVAFPIANFILGSKATAFFFIPPFLISTIGGSIIAYVLLKIPQIKTLLTSKKGA